MPVKGTVDGPFGHTDLTRWRLDSTDHGRHIWSYQPREDEDDRLGAPNPLTLQQEQRDYQTNEEKYWLGLPTDTPVLEDPHGDPFKAAKNGYEFMKQLQSPDGHWAGEYGGPLFLIPGMIITLYATKTPIPEEWKIEIARYLANVQRQGGKDDRGWGLHDHGRSTVFGTALNYVALRILGVDKDEPMMINARATLHALGGATGSPSWGKAWLSILGVYEWDGMNAIPPELWLLPKWIPVHPWRWWTHTRAVYIPMGYLFGKRFQVPLNKLTQSLREEIYVEPYATINWPSCRNKCARVDLYCPHSKLLDTLYLGLGAWERFLCPSMVREAGIREAYRLLCMEDDNTNCQTIGPVSKAMNMLCRWVEEGPDSSAFKNHLETVRDFFWQSPRGMLVCGTNGSQAWDAGFAGQMLYETGLADLPENQESVKKLLAWLDDTQHQEDTPWVTEAHRHPSKGAWPFSTREQHYTVSDCTSEALKAVIYLQRLDYTPKVVTKERMTWAIDIILSLQNPDGGFASYELIRGTKYMELINPAEVFGNIMIEYNYPECTTACLTALSIFSRLFPDYRTSDIKQTMSKAMKYIHASQRPDGSWFGSWGVCFTYATMFALESLALNGETCETSERARRACSFIVSKQMPDGGWGESYEACETGEWVDLDRSTVINTSWAVIALLTAKYPDPEPIKKACRLIMNRQQPNGEWLWESTCGIFNKSTCIDYPLFLFIWTTWALGKAAKELDWSEA
ncbi:terpene synthase [Cystobasidium minutum MCA 4210]|uniref:terpene synthase n=1 Tax=Cystobasidium minutum MCA 4210 TaxID=1397322 RepID=UPI0034CD2A60|eukprot:jgi/Rhomi1/184572/fgenesh1_pm.9_\